MNPHGFFPISAVKVVPQQHLTAVVEGTWSNAHLPGGKGSYNPCYLSGAQGPHFFPVQLSPALSLAVVEYNTRHRWFGNKRNRRHWSLPWHKDRTGSCDIAHWLPGSCLPAVLFPFTEPIKVCLSFFHFHQKWHFPLFHYHWGSRDVWHLPSLSGDWKDLPLQC